MSQELVSTMVAVVIMRDSASKLVDSLSPSGTSSNRHPRPSHSGLYFIC